MCSSQRLLHGDRISSSILLFGPGAAPAPGEKSPESCPFFLLGHVNNERHEQRGRGAPNPRQVTHTAPSPEPGTHP